VTIRVLLVDDHRLFRSGIRAMLKDATRYEIVGEASNGREAVEMCEKLSPQLVLMDIAMPMLNGIEATRRIVRAAPQAKVLIISMHSDPQYVRQALSAGAAGFVLKDAAFVEMLTAIETVTAGKTYLPPTLAEPIMVNYLRGARGDVGASDVEKLTPREREVLQLIGEGRANTEIAKQLFLSIRTVETHRQNIMEKLDVHTISGLTRFAIRHGLCALDP
jgi:DNA-binding NarL/FixJ family response regulator